MVIGPCVIKTRLSASCLGFRRAGTLAASIPMLRAVESNRANSALGAAIQEPPAVMWGFQGEREVPKC